MYVVHTIRQDIPVRRSFACTRQELPRELAMAAGVSAAAVIGYSAVPPSQRHLTDIELKRVYAYEADHPLSTTQRWRPENL